MTFYNIAVWMHIVFAFVLIVPLIFIPKLFYLYQTEKGLKILHKIHFITGLGGWVLFLSGMYMLYLQGWVMVSFYWMQLSIGLYIAMQLFDNFWSDKQEELLAHGETASTNKLKIWSVIKVVGYMFIALLMVFKIC